MVRNIKGDKTPHIRLYSKAKIMGYRRNKHVQQPNQTIIKIEGCKTKEAAQYYLGKRVAYLYNVHTKKATQKSMTRCLWGRIMKPHGSTGSVMVKFRKNINPRSFGASCRVMMFPQRA
eukprot:Clim_evm14s142 gene=Clim_evmTU14s142